MFTRIRCVVNVLLMWLWEKKRTLTVCHCSLQRTGKGDEFQLSCPDCKSKSNHWIFMFFVFSAPPHANTHTRKHKQVFLSSCDDWRLDSQSTFNACLQSIMDVYFVYCWFAKSMFCVTDNVVSSSVRLCSFDTRMFKENICLCSNQCLFIRQVLLCLLVFSTFLLLILFCFSSPLCKVSIRWTCLQWFVF